MSILSRYLRTLALCAAVAVITQIIWGGSYYVHGVISLAYGFIGASSRQLIEFLRPAWPQKLKYAVTTIAAISLGTLHAWWWVSGYGDFPAIDFLIVAMIITTLIYQFNLNRDQSYQLETKHQEAKLQQAQQQKTLMQSQLKVLQSQIEPHFLFNTLANLKMLIRHDPQKAELLLDNFSDLLRFSLKKSRSDQVSLKDELNSLECYLAIQKIRLGERLQYKVELTDEVNLGAAVPPLLVQPLVENAIFHGIEPAAKGGLVSLKVKREGIQWVIEVEDNGVGLEASNEKSNSGKHNGIALNNLHSTLKCIS
ncbi:histidine kinase [Microbulbifer sp. OS29]|uniref:Histidine kinase n=1 Tax=Microbulbifer okhotskensis TaxID=2926617 RepID=A0A9X2J8A3_9GAMM|nr:histidine kinase [Microbulbifer okhotskensis]MCO1336660.1 histidine kinase [Microbulbifer okhotskensis]